MPKGKVKMEPGEPANPIPLASEGEDSQPSWYNSDEELYSDSDSEIIGYDDDVTQAAAARASHSTPQHLTPAAKAAILRAEPGAPAKSQSSSAAGLAGHSRALGHDAARGVGGARRKTSRVATMNVDDEAFGGTDDEMFDTIGDLKSERLPASHAKKEYKVTDKDLKPLKYKAALNPHHPYAAPMKLYLRSDVIRLARQVRARKQAWEGSKAERAKSAALDQKERTRTAAAQAKAMVDAFRPLRIVPADSGLHGAWPIIVKHVAAHSSPTKERGAEFVTTSARLRYLLKLGSTCKEMLHLVHCIGLPTLGRQEHPNTWEGVGLASQVGSRGEKWLPPLWNILVSNPTVLKLHDLKIACKQLREKQTGTKDELIVRLYARLKIPGPKQAPAALAFALLNEKTTFCDPSTIAKTTRTVRPANQQGMTGHDLWREALQAQHALSQPTPTVFTHSLSVSEGPRTARVPEASGLGKLMPGYMQYGLPSLETFSRTWLL